MFVWDLPVPQWKGRHCCSIKLSSKPQSYTFYKCSYAKNCTPSSLVSNEMRQELNAFQRGIIINLRKHDQSQQISFIQFLFTRGLKLIKVKVM